MLNVDKALKCILENAPELKAESVTPDDVTGRILAEDVIAQTTQPPFAASAMDGYAVKRADIAAGQTLTVIGEAPAGTVFSKPVLEGQAVRIFTGAAIPPGCDHVIIQENVTRAGNKITISDGNNSASHIRAVGLDFNKGDRLIESGTQLHSLHGALVAAANLASVKVVRKPRIVFFSNGSELREPGQELEPGAIVNTNRYAIGALIAQWGGEGIYGGLVEDDPDQIKAIFENNRDADVIVPIGGASVGDHDLVKPAFAALGGTLLIEKIAIRPGKPTWFGPLPSGPPPSGPLVLGLPGNPASSIVTASLFLQALVKKMAGHAQSTLMREKACLVEPLAKNGARETYLRGQTAGWDGATRLVKALPLQDSALLHPFLNADLLICRKSNCEAAITGDEVEVVLLR